MKPLIALYIILLHLSLSAIAAAAEWQQIKNHAFQFSVPTNFEKSTARGRDSFVEEYLGEGIKLSFDYGMYSNNFGDWPDDTKFEEVEVAGKNARIGVAKHEFHDGFDYSTKIYFKLREHLALSMFAACKTEDEVALAKKIFLTIEFVEKEP